MIRGRMRYLPKVVIQEIEDLKMEKSIQDDGLALHEIVKFARVGREMERMMTFNFNHYPTKDPDNRRGRRKK